MFELSFSLLWALAYLTPLLAHPLLVALNLILLSLTTGTLIGLTLSSWVSVALILMFLGGMMVIFVYFTSLVTNEKLTFKPSLFSVSAVLAAGALAPALLAQPSCVATGIFNFNPISFAPLAMLLIYLLFTLFIVVELTMDFKGSVESSSF